MMEVFDAIATRASVRKYDPREVEPEKLARILEAGRLAPSAKNEQEWNLFAVTDRETIAGMEPAFNGQKFVATAPALLGVCVKNDRLMACGVSARTVDASIAMSFMMLEAVELGLGTCWLGNFNAPAVKQALNIPEEYTLIALTAAGYPAQECRPRPRKAPEEVIFYDRRPEE